MDAKEIVLSPEEREIVKQFEDGRQLRDTLATPGWQLILDIMEKRVIQAETQLINCDTCDKELLTALHRRARAVREFFQEIQHTIATRIEGAAQIPTAIRSFRGQSPLVDGAAPFTGLRSLEDPMADQW